MVCCREAGDSYNGSDWDMVTPRNIFAFLSTLSPQLQTASLKEARLCELPSPLVNDRH